MAIKASKLAEEIGADIVERTTTEAGCVVWWDMYDAGGNRVNVTLRAPTYQQVTSLLAERKNVVDTAAKGGWKLRQASQPAIAQQKPLASANSSDGGTFETASIRADTVGFLVQGGNFREFGIRAWPEVWEAAKIEPAEGEFAGYTATWGLNNKGHKKIFSIKAT